MRILKLREDFHKTMVNYASLFPNENDARVTIFSKCINVLDYSFLSFYFYNFYLTEDEWWNSIPSNIPVVNPPLSEIIRHVETFDNATMMAVIQLLHISLESSIRPMIEAYNLEEYSKRCTSFGRICAWFLEKEQQLVKYRPILDIINVMRNILHDNGVYYGKDRSITISNNKFELKDRTRPEFITWSLIFDLIPMIKDMSIAVIEIVKHYEEIPDLSISKS